MWGNLEGKDFVEYLLIKQVTRKNFSVLSCGEFSIIYIGRDKKVPHV